MVIDVICTAEDRCVIAFIADAGRSRLVALVGCALEDVHILNDESGPNGQKDGGRMPFQLGYAGRICLHHVESPSPGGDMKPVGRSFGFGFLANDAGASLLEDG